MIDYTLNFRAKSPIFNFISLSLTFYLFLRIVIYFLNIMTLKKFNTQFKLIHTYLIFIHNYSNQTLKSFALVLYYT